MGIVNVRVRRQTFKINCRDGEEDAVLRNARHVQSRMDKIGREAGVADGERVAIMAALMLSADAANIGAVHSDDDKNGEKTAAVNDDKLCDYKKQVNKMNEKIEATLVRTNGPLR